MENEIPIWEKATLTLEEAAAYSGIGINRLRDLTKRRIAVLYCLLAQKIDQKKTL